MLADDLIVEVRDRDLVRQGQVDSRFLPGALFAPRVNGVGAWSLRLPASLQGEPFELCTELRKPGAGVVVTPANDEAAFMSGLVDYATCDRDADDPEGWWTFTGYPDNVLVYDALAYPDPGTLNPAVQTKDADARTGAAETLLYAYVGANMGPSAPSGRITGWLWERLVLGVNGGRGPTRSLAPSFQNLMELCQDLTAGTDLLFRVVQDGDDLRFETSVTADLTDAIRLDIDNDQLTTVQTGFGAPTVTQAIVASAADGPGRSFAAATDNDAAVEWGRRREQFFVGSGSDLTDLQVQALTAIQNNRPTSFQVVPAEDLLLTDTTVTSLIGATVAVVVDDVEVPARVNQVAISVSDEGDVLVGVALGDDDGTDWEGQVNRSLTSLTSRVSAMERNTGADTDWVDITADVTLAPGLSWSSGGSIWACLVGGMVSIRMDNATTDAAGFFNVGVSGNIANTYILTGVPSRFCPSVVMPLAHGASGRLTAYYINASGSVAVSAVAPSTNWTTATPYPAGEGFSFGGSYPAG